jgi:hypothetical protein
MHKAGGELPRMEVRQTSHPSSNHFREIEAKKQRPTEEAGLQALLAKEVQNTPNTRGVL